MQTQQKLFTNRMLLTLLWPLVVEQALNVLVGMSDTVMVSSVGEAAISGVSLVDMINYLILNIFAALATGGAVITSQFLGAKKPGEASRSAGQLVTLSSILGTAVMALCLLLRGPMLRPSVPIALNRLLFTLLQPTLPQYKISIILKFFRFLFSKKEQTTPVIP